MVDGDGYFGGYEGEGDSWCSERGRRQEVGEDVGYSGESD